MAEWDAWATETLPSVLAQVVGFFAVTGLLLSASIRWARRSI